MINTIQGVSSLIMQTLIIWQLDYDPLKIATQLAIWVNEVLSLTLMTPLRCDRHMDESFAILLLLNLGLDNMRTNIETLIELQISTSSEVKCNQHLLISTISSMVILNRKTQWASHNKSMMIDLLQHQTSWQRLMYPIGAQFLLLNKSLNQKDHERGSLKIRSARLQDRREK